MVRAGSKKTYSAPAIEKAFEIIELLSRRPEGALVSEMAADLGRSVGELFRIVVVMEQLGYLRRSEVTERYAVAYKLLDVALRSTPSQDLVRASLPEMQILARETVQSCHLVVASEGHGLVVAREESQATRGFALKVGAHINLVQSCSGQVLLAFSNLNLTERMVRAAEEENGAAVDRSWLADRLATVRRLGYDSRKSPITFGVTDISYPIFGFDRIVVAALTIPFLALIDGSQKMDLDAAREKLRAATARISDRLGYEPE
ncbi:IclR family transcriptional regulator [Sphingomonas sp.]|uniref:IclR family transcriptional regulator n=1 Tax=Sphingomonas sp. TaxID=28214 RepID=UPI0028A786BE|nr:IclR family transcriptional regulator [Sphingomonas sp.]